MASILEPKSKQKEAKRAYVTKPKKLCTKCLTEKDLGDFYINRQFESQMGHDAWCKACFAKCVTKEAMKNYFWENNRAWSEALWESCMESAERKLSENDTFNKLGPEAKNSALERVACSRIPTQLGAVGVYRYEEHEPMEPQQEDDAAANDRTPRYSSEFNGYFKKSELEYLRNYYKGLESDFELNDTNIRDLARKLAKASLQADKAQNDFMMGRCDYSVVKDAISQFDLLSKSGNFAACKRKPGDTGGLGSWAEITLRLEQTGHPCTRKIKWEQDDVDRVLAEYQHIAESLALDGQ